MIGTDATPNRLEQTGAVIVTGIEVALAVRCARSLAVDLPPERIVVVVNPPGAAAEVLAELEQFAQVVRNADPDGYGACLNRGADMLPPEVEYLLLLNDDVVVDPHGLRTLVGALVERSDVAVVGPNLIGEDGVAQETVFRFPSVRSELAQAAILPQRLHRALRGRYAAQADPSGHRYVDWVLGAALLVRREAFRQAGGFDERFVFYSEETDLCRRLLRSGWRTLSCGEATFVHVGAASTSRGTEVAQRFGEMMGASRRLYARIHWNRARRLSLALATAGVLVWNVAYVLARVAAAPRTSSAKFDLLRTRWAGRPSLQSRRDAQ